MQSEIIKGITIEGVLELVTPELDGSVIVLLRNAKDSRTEDGSEFGALLPEFAENAEQNAKRMLDSLLGNLGEKDKSSIDILVIASNTSLKMPDGRTSPHKRALETAESVLKGVKSSMLENGLNNDHLLNKSEHPIELRSGVLTDLKALEESPEFISYMLERYRTEPEFWEAFESDVEKDVRVKMGAEGPNEIAERVNSYMGVLNNALDFYHRNHPGRRVVTIVVGHYDNLSPYIKQLLGKDMSSYLPIDYGSGIQVKINADKSITAHVEGEEFRIEKN